MAYSPYGAALELMVNAQRQYFELFFPYLNQSRSLVPLSSRAVERSERVEHLDVQREQEQVVQVGQEVVTVEKQRVPGEATRIRRVVTEKPFEQRVELHDEIITVERRRVAAQGDDEAVTEREYLMIDTREIPVINKHTVVREELVLRKKVSGRVETIRDKVRSSDVEVIQPQRMPAVREVEKKAQARA